MRLAVINIHNYFCTRVLNSEEDTAEAEEVGHATNCVIIHVTFLKFFLMLP